MALETYWDVDWKAEVVDGRRNFYPENTTRKYERTLRHIVVQVATDCEYKATAGHPASLDLRDRTGGM